MTATTDTNQLAGLVYDMPAEDYHAHPALGSTSIKTLGDPELSMADVRYQLENTEHKDAYDIGTLGHALILEGDLESHVKIIEYDDYRTKAAQAERDQARNEGLIPVKRSEVATKIEPLYDMQREVMEHEIAGEILRGSHPEVSLFWEDNGVQLKGRLDAYRPDIGVVADLKLVQSAQPNSFRKQISDLGYYIQAEDYLNGVEQITGFRPDFLFIAVSKTYPYSVSVHRLESSTREAAQIRIQYALTRYRQAIETGHWPGYSGIYEQSLMPWESIKNEALQEALV